MISFKIMGCVREYIRPVCACCEVEDKLVINFGSPLLDMVMAGEEFVYALREHVTSDVSL